MKRKDSEQKIITPEFIYWNEDEGMGRMIYAYIP